MYFSNRPIKGQIEIYKSGELFNIKDNSFNYDGKNH